MASSFIIIMILGYGAVPENVASWPGWNAVDNHTQAGGVCQFVERQICISHILTLSRSMVVQSPCELHLFALTGGPKKSEVSRKAAIEDTQYSDICLGCGILVNNNKRM